MSRFFYLDYDIHEISKCKYICIYVLELDHKCILRVFKTFNDDLKIELDGYEQFEDITDSVSYVIKRNGKISLDIHF